MSVDLSTRYLGLDLAHPVVVSACSLGFDRDNLRRMEDAGASAVVLPSLFEEQIVHDQMAVHEFYEFTSDKFPEALSVFPDMDDSNSGPEAYLRLVESAKRSLAVPVIGSLNGTSSGGWIRYAKLIQDAGADALELNVYRVVTDSHEDGPAVEARDLELVSEVCKSVTIPVAVKIGPYFSALPNLAVRLAGAGASGLVMFNRFYQPDIDLETLRVAPRLVLSTSDEVRLPMRWIAVLYGRVRASLAATTGVHTHEDVLKLLLAGADVTMVASALYTRGIGHLRAMIDGTRSWLEERDYTSVAQMKGSISQINAPDPEAFERANYIKTLVDYTGTEATT
ncbi:dihydroorotate dehydrogenase-like protein [Tautonia plasticadhaerens]|uniref:NAD-dependent dihydropyrimidine dehydrogenase subunit PreA n=1 Tax=Tautonia plasticadhaerens TaxID=2527974 RepID=A0A518H3I8_9BACT|nr:dihydroorotate dehydrogenase-like protein [Tautonia plasticadhaerens]QDV35387.1 NAD-dependent dihydropyrimidine dehydrogenase subunit PreA [Tautonia plasticadhaerens]